MNEIDTINIPAYQRKRSISAKERASNNIYKRPTVTKKTPNKPAKVTRKRVEKIDPTNEIPISRDMSLDSFFAPSLSFTQSAHPAKLMDTCGFCEGYFEKIDVAIIKLTRPLKIGDQILIERTEGLFQQEIKSMQIDRKEVKIARTGSDIGLKVDIKPKVGGTVYKIVS